VLFLNTYDIRGGAGRGAYRHHKALQRVGVESRMLVQHKHTTDESVICAGTGPRERLLALFRNLDLLPLLAYPKFNRVPWAVGWLNNKVARKVEKDSPDIVHLHWVGHGFVPIRALAEFNRPIVWQLADPWAFTGGCHYPQGCLRYRESCGQCPQLASKRENDLSRWTWKQKKRYWEKIDLTIVTQSRWMRDCAKSSSLFRGRRVQIIPAGLDTRIFQPIHRKSAREAENLPLEKKIILSGATHSTRDPRKGFTYLIQALNSLARNGWRHEAEVLVFGARTPKPLPDVGLKTTYLGHVSDERLTRLYSGADVFVAPAREEAFGQTVLEALSCGTPCAAFRVGGIPDMVEHGVNGYLAKPFDPEDLAKAVSWIIEDPDRNRSLSEQARKTVERDFDIEKVARRYTSIYQEVLQGHRRSPPTGQPTKLAGSVMESRDSYL